MQPHLRVQLKAHAVTRLRLSANTLWGEQAAQVGCLSPSTGKASIYLFIYSLFFATGLIQLCERMNVSHVLWISFVGKDGARVSCPIRRHRTTERSRAEISFPPGKLNYSAILFFIYYENVTYFSENCSFSPSTPPVHLAAAKPAASQYSIHFLLSIKNSFLLELSKMDVQEFPLTISQTSGSLALNYHRNQAKQGATWYRVM